MLQTFAPQCPTTQIPESMYSQTIRVGAVQSIGAAETTHDPYLDLSRGVRRETLPPRTKTLKVRGWIFRDVLLTSHIPPTSDAPLPLGKDSGSQSGDVSNLRPDLKRRCTHETVPPTSDAPLPNPHPAKTRRTAREVTPLRGSQCMDIVTPTLHRLPPTPGNGVGSQDIPTPNANEDFLDIPSPCSPIKAAASSRGTASLKSSKRNAFRELFEEDSDSE